MELSTNRPYLLILLLHRLEGCLEVHRLLDLCPQQSPQHCFGGDLHPLQGRSIPALQISDLLGQILNLGKSEKK